MEYPNNLTYIYIDMKFEDILGKNLLNEDWKEDYKKVAYKVKLMYKTLRKGGFKIGNLIPDMVPFWTGFEIIHDKDTLITYELPTKYHLTPGNQVSPYWLVITGITINCEKHPHLGDDIDIREDILRRLSRKFNNALKGTFDEGEEIKIEVWRKPDLSSDFENTIDESRLLDKPNEDFSEIVKKAPTVYKALKKGTVTMDIETYHLGRVIKPKKVTINYMLSDLYKVETDPFENNYNVKILIPTITLDCPEEPELNNNQKIKLDILDIVKKKFNNFGLTVFLRPSHFYLKHNGTWVNL